MKWVSSRSPATATAQSASWNCTAWKEAMGLPNWMRPFTCSTASSTARSQVPRTDAVVSATWNRTSTSVSPSLGTVSRRSVDLQVDDERSEPGAERGGRPGGRAWPHRRAGRPPTGRTGRRGRPAPRRRARGRRGDRRRRRGARTRRDRAAPPDRPPRTARRQPPASRRRRAGRARRRPALGSAPADVAGARGRVVLGVTSGVDPAERRRTPCAAAAPNSSASSGSSGFTGSTP